MVWSQQVKPSTSAASRFVAIVRVAVKFLVSTTGSSHWLCMVVDIVAVVLVVVVVVVVVVMVMFVGVLLVAVAVVAVAVGGGGGGGGGGRRRRGPGPGRSSGSRIISRGSKK